MVVEQIDDSLKVAHPRACDPAGLTISFGARWIFRQRQIEGLFHNRLVNAHGARLPLDRGGGGMSWRIMRGDRIGCLLLHLVDGGIDTGPVVARKDFVIPGALRTPAEIQADYERRLAEFVVAYMESGAPMDHLVAQPTDIGTYYPRLHTPTHGWIDWSWSAEEIDRFILAFDAPHPGARTCWRGSNVVVRQAQAHYGEPPHHPFQTGLVVRSNGRWLVVALRGGASLIIEDLRSEDGEDLLTKVREGDRLFTPTSALEGALQQRVSVGPQGVRLPGG